MAFQPFALIRFGVYGVLLLFSLIVLGLGGNLTDKTSGWSFPGFSVAVAVLTMLSLIPLLVIDLIRNGSFISWVAVELAVFSILWVLWLASAALSTSTGLFISSCDLYRSSLASLCRQYSALQAFSWLSWLLIKAYIVLVVVLAILAMMKGHKRVWLCPTSDLSFSPTHTNSGEPKIPPPGSHSATPYSASPPAQYGQPGYGQAVYGQPGYGQAGAIPQNAGGYVPPPPPHQGPPVSSVAQV